MTEPEWLAAESPRPLAEWLQTNSISKAYGLSRKYRLLNCGCCWLLAPWFSDRLSECVIRAERFADGKLTERTFAKWGELATTICRPLYENPGAHLRANQAVCGLFSYRLVSYSAQSDAWRAICIDRELFGETVAGNTAAMLRDMIYDIFGNPFRPIVFDSEWRTSTAVSLAQGMYESRDFSIMPILGDALQDAGCEHTDILAHCRGNGPHVRGCWVVDLVLGKV